MIALDIFRRSGVAATISHQIWDPDLQPAVPTGLLDSRLDPGLGLVAGIACARLSAEQDGAGTTVVVVGAGQMDAIDRVGWPARQQQEDTTHEG